MKKILVVDDDGATRNLLSNYLGDAGFQCVVAASATEGVQLFEREKPDVVLIDMLMPYVGGAAAIADVRRAARRLGLMVSVAGMTAGDAEDFKDAIAAGADVCIPKPIRNREWLLAQLHELENGHSESA